MHRRTTVIAAVALAIAALSAWYIFSSVTRFGIPEQPTPLTSQQIQVGGPFTLLAHTGKAISDDDFRGRYMLVFFGYTFCPDVCPTALNEMAMTLDALGNDAEIVQPLFITIDPQRDTPEVLAEYVAAFDRRIIGLTGTAQQIASAAKAYHTYYAKAEIDGSSGDNYFMDHSAFIYLMGPDGRFLTALPYHETADQIARTIRSYIQKNDS